MAPPHKLNDARLREEFAEGHSYREIGRRLGVHQSTVAHAVRRLELPRRNIRVDDIRAKGETLAQAYRQGASITALAETHSVDRRVITTLLREMGLEISPGATGALNYQWRGGRATTASGYIKVRLASDDPHVVMADSNDYVLEHRLVMARHLGRCLLSTETVHHINGDRADNSVENLQLRQGRHGSGVVMCCADCGSNNLRPCELD